MKKKDKKEKLILKHYLNWGSNQILSIQIIDRQIISKIQHKNNFNKKKNKHLQTQFKKIMYARQQ